MKYPIELSSLKEVERFSNAIQRVDADVWLVGEDEHGHPWYLSAKSLLASLCISKKAQKQRKHTAHDVDWNTISCECDEDIYCAIRDFIKE